MDVCAAVAVAAGKPLEVMEIDLDSPREGEVVDEIKAAGICHTDEFTLSGALIPKACFRPFSVIKAPAWWSMLPEIAVAKVNPGAPFDKICYIGCCVTTGIGAVISAAKVEQGATAVVFGLGGIGLNVIQGLKLASADMIIGVDLNNEGLGREVRHDAFRQSEGDRRRYCALPRQHDQARRRLHVR